MVKNPPANAGHQGLIPGLGRFPLEKGMATHSSILDWSIPMDRGAWQLQSVHCKELNTTEQLTTSFHVHLVFPASTACFFFFLLFCLSQPSFPHPFLSFLHWVFQHAGTQLLDQEWNQSPLSWKLRVLATWAIKEVPQRLLLHPISRVRHRTDTVSVCISKKMP